MGGVHSSCRTSSIGNQEYFYQALLISLTFYHIFIHTAVKLKKENGKEEGLL
jgi:hypothetical protein